MAERFYATIVSYWCRLAMVFILNVKNELWPVTGVFDKQRRIMSFAKRNTFSIFGSWLILDSRDLSGGNPCFCVHRIVIWPTAPDPRPPDGLEGGHDSGLFSVLATSPPVVEFLVCLRRLELECADNAQKPAQLTSHDRVITKTTSIHELPLRLEPPPLMPGPCSYPRAEAFLTLFPGGLTGP